ncbi:hypothetical protein DFP72DRAFT_355037 [Ephemerocybe angulata]|uniref:NACHT domain-containing protein n=1 Tax=Ephemerocybe angulata TaxID=980116 RepID=A0A8H6HXF7_9AGAR|nr:hypothetical protein DFP72DRAFT_355037 [Tulosesus angulatus]
MASGAIHDSEERCDAPKCMPETRVAVQNEILSWITDGYKDPAPKKIMWVSGPAGTGKTAILGTIAERCKEMGTMAASFFFSSFSGSVARRSKKRLVATLAYQVLQHDSLDGIGVHGSVYQAIRSDPAILKKRLNTQFDKLVLHPFRQQGMAGEPLPQMERMVILVDGLDECDTVEDQHKLRDPSSEHYIPPRTNEDDQREILSALLHAANDPSFPFVIIVASRPEQAIKEFFISVAQDATRPLFLDTKYNPDADIRLFYEAKFSGIRRRFNLPPSWPGPHAMSILVDSASGQFVYATTVIRFIEGSSLDTQTRLAVDEALRTPHQRLERILGLQARVGASQLRPLEALDVLYETVLRTCPEPLLSVKWIRAIRTFMREPVAAPIYEPQVTRSSAPIWLVRLLLELSPGEEQYALGPLSSLIHVPQGDYSGRTQFYTFYHKSFLDFIEDQGRSGGLYISPHRGHDFVVHRYFQTLDGHLARLPLGLEERHYLSMNYVTEDVFSFFHRDAFEGAQADLLSCDARRWTEYIVHNRGIRTSGYFIDRMFSAMHQWCSWFGCHPACKRWRKIILTVLKENDWTVPSGWKIFKDRWISDVDEWDFYPPRRGEIFSIRE